MTFALTKIRPPRLLASYVPRAAIDARVAQALATRRAVLVCAPAGYGKTSLLSRALASLPAASAVAWISADAGDDVQGLLECLLAALEPFDPPWRVSPEAMVQRAGRSADEQRAVAAEVINTLEAMDAPHGVVVFDDLHRVEDPAFFRLLDHLLERLGTRWTLVMSSRTDPPVALARLRAAGELAEFRQLQLQFARDEARRLASEAGVEAAVADRVFDRTQGWPAGMRLAVGALQSGGAIERALASGERPMFDFLMVEVMGQLPAPLAEFLLRSSVLPQLEVARCIEVTGDEHAAARLEEIERRGLFVDALEGGALRLHDLFRDALQSTLRARDPALHRELQRRAAETEPDGARRIGLLVEIGEHEAAAEAAWRVLPAMIVRAGPSVPQHLWAQFPAAFRERSAQLQLLRGLLAWVSWDWSAMEDGFRRAEALFLARGDAERGALASAYRATNLVSLGRLVEAREIVDRLAGRALKPDARIALLNAMCWLAIESGETRQVAPRHEEMLALLEAQDGLALWYHTSPPIRLPGVPAIGRGLLRHADLMLRVAGDEPTVLRPLAFLARAWCAAWRGELPASLELQQRAREEAAWSGDSGAIRHHSLTLRAITHAMAGEHAQALEAARARYALRMEVQGAWVGYLLAHFVARVAAMGDSAPALREAIATLDGWEPVMRADGTPPDARRRHSLAAQLAWLEGREEEAVAGWRAALEHEEAIDLYRHAVEVRLRLARALVRKGDLRGAAAILAPALAQVEAEAVPGTLLLAFDAAAELCAVEWKGELATRHVGVLRQCLRLPRLRSDASPAPAVAGDGPEALTPRELEVLERLAAGHSNKVIARSLDLSLHTVKRHVANILGKLGASTRGQAAAWLRGRTEWLPGPRRDGSFD